MITLQIYTNIFKHTTNSQIFLGIQTIYKQYKLHYVVIPTYLKKIIIYILRRIILYILYTLYLYIQQFVDF